MSRWAARLGRLRRLLGLGLRLALVLVIATGALRGITWARGTATLGPALAGSPQIFDWQYDSPAFGGLSALVMAPDGSTLMAGGDRGDIFEARVLRTAAGRITGLADVVETHMQDHNGVPVDRFKGDLEGLTRMSDGRLGLAFEGYTRLQIVRAPGSRPGVTHGWDLFEDLFGNTAFETILTLPDGRLMAIREMRTQDNRAEAAVQTPRSWKRGYHVPASPGFRVTGGEIGPDGCLYTVERRYGLAGGFRFRVMRHAQPGGLWSETAPWRSELIYEAPPARLGNAEGLFAWQRPDGTPVLTVITDNGFFPGTPTRLIEFPLTAPGACV